ncbi:hypothetical protein SKAU_G00101030, partial [Synaphobranchus kaupii]
GVQSPLCVLANRRKSLNLRQVRHLKNHCLLWAVLGEKVLTWECSCRRWTSCAGTESWRTGSCSSGALEWGGVAVGVLNDHVTWEGLVRIHHHELAPVLHRQAQETLDHLSNHTTLRLHHRPEPHCISSTKGQRVNVHKVSGVQF